jgi:hypothetical protein
VRPRTNFREHHHSIVRRGGLKVKLPSTELVVLPLNVTDATGNFVSGLIAVIYVIGLVGKPGGKITPD